ncbi:unnamed protein product [Auanema sp. JU1783]|nr:unnamed protein product [Auanema sp. JU1783]
MDKAKRRLASALDGFRSNHSKMDISVDERVNSEHCCLKKVVRFGFPDESRCLAYDPVQRLLAIGTEHGTVRIIGEVGVDHILRHGTDHGVNHIQFVINDGSLITACSNDMIHLWNYRLKVPEIKLSIEMNKENVSTIHLPMNSKYLYVGTIKGNVYFVSLDTFQLSPYVIMWNKAIDLSCRIHPGPVRQIAACPTDPSKILIAFERGIVIQWNLATKEVDRFPLDPPIKSVSWHYDGKQVMTGNVDGSVSVFNTKKTSEPAHKSFPHGQTDCRPIPNIDWKHTGENEQVVVFSGGMPTDDGLPPPALTILKASRHATVMEMENPIISFITLQQVPYNSSPQQPHAIAVLLKHDLMIIDLQTPGYPIIESPHAMDLHESPVTCLQYYSDCPSDLIGALTLVGYKQRKKGFSERQWPINGGHGRECATGFQELVITGHKDGSLRFWQASGENLQILYRLKTGSHFERLEELESSEKVSHAIKYIEMCLESRLLLVAGISGQVTLFRFAKSETTNTIAVVHIPNLCVTSNSSIVDERPGLSSQSSKEMKRQKKVVSRDSTASPDTSDASGDERIVPFKVRGAPVKRPAGYQPELACLIPWPSHVSSDMVTSIALNSAYGVIAIGTTSGLALVDIAQCALIYAWSTAELYGSDPTPAIQLSNQLSDASSPLEEEEPNSELLDVHYQSRSKSPSIKSRGMSSIFRRNTSEMSSSARDKFSPDRPDVDGRSPSPNVAGKEVEDTNQARPSSRSQSVKGGIIRRLTKKRDNISPGCLSEPRNNLIRLNTDTRQKSLDKRPLLFKAQSVIEQHSNGSPRGEHPKESPSLSRSGNTSSPAVSTHSLEKLGLGESVTSVQFIHSCSKRNEAKTSPCIWIGTSTGAAIALNLILPQDRLVSTVVVAPSGTIVRMKGQILLHAFMDEKFCIVSPASESYKESSRESKDSGSPEKSVTNKIVTKPSLSPAYSSSLDCSDEVNQFLIVVAENEIKVIALPSFSQAFHYKTEEIPLVKAVPTHVRGHPVLMCLTAAGYIQVISLPSLRLLHSAQLLPRSVDVDDPICHQTAFSEHGLGIFMTSPSEMEKYTICTELAEQTADSMGELYVTCEMPEAPKSSSFLKGVSSIFGNSPRQADATDLECILSGDKDKSVIGGSAGMRSIARTIPGPAANMDRAHASGISAGQAAQMALQNLNERSDKLNAVVDSTENLKNSAMNMASRSTKLVEKFEKKKWYNF